MDEELSVFNFLIEVVVHLLDEALDFTVEAFDAFLDDLHGLRSHSQLY